jgi:RNA-binding protein
MPTLTGKEKPKLRAKGQRLTAMCSLGKTGLTDAVIAQIDALLARHKLIKIRLADEQGAARTEAATRIADATQSALVGVVGKTVLLFREKTEEKKGKGARS